MIHIQTMPQVCGFSPQRPSFKPFLRGIFDAENDTQAGSSLSISVFTVNCNSTSAHTYPSHSVLH